MNEYVHSNTEQFCIVDNYIYANNNKKESIIACPWQQLLRECAKL